MKKALALVAVAGLAGLASAQTATVTTTANGGNAVSVAPGTAVNLAVAVTYTGGVQLAGLQGGVKVAGDAGTGSNFAFNLGAGPLINTGSFTGGSRLGMDVASGPPLFFGINPLWANQPVNMLSYQVTINDPGVYQVIWQSPATAPNARIYTSATSASFAEAQTTYVGATITVTPAPASLALVGLGGLVAGRRRR